MNERMTRPMPRGQAKPARTDLRSTHLDRALSWSDFRAAVRFDPASRLLLAVPAISAKRAERPWLGEATGPHTRIGTGEMYRREFAHGAVYWSERTGAHEVHGVIAEHWHGIGAEASFLGLPTTDEQAFGATDHGGRRAGGFAHFEGGSIYWTPAHGPAIVFGMVRDIWALLGWERSQLGLPVCDVERDPESGLLRGGFEHGTVEWSSSIGPIVVIGETADSSELHPAGRGALDRLQPDFAPAV